MPWFKSEAWGDILEDCCRWKILATYQVENPRFSNPPSSELSALTRRIMKWCDEHTHIDPTPLWTLYQRAEEWYQPGRHPGVTVSQHKLEATFQDCICILERLYQIGVSETKPAADKKTDKKKKIKNPIPRNPAVLELARQIKDGYPQAGTRREIALDFSGGDERKATSLLRQLQPSRYAWLLD